MSDYNNTNRFSIWKNDKRESDKHPYFNGTINVDGKEFWLSMWWHKDRPSDKHPVFTGSIKPKEQKSEYSESSDDGILF